MGHNTAECMHPKLGTRRIDHSPNTMDKGPFAVKILNLMCESQMLV